MDNSKDKVEPGNEFGRLTVRYDTEKRKNGSIVWLCECECGKVIEVQTRYLTNDWTRSCGCLKKDQDAENLRVKYENKRINEIVMPLFKDKEPRKDSSTGYRGVAKYYTRKSKELRYRAWITVKGKQYYKSGFLTPEDAYYNGRLKLEEKHLPVGGKRK